jgi:DNA-binding IclR family transcriptional regulator
MHDADVRATIRATILRSLHDGGLRYKELYESATGRSLNEESPKTKATFYNQIQSLVRFGLVRKAKRGYYELVPHSECPMCGKAPGRGRG